MAAGLGRRRYFLLPGAIRGDGISGTVTERNGVGVQGAADCTLHSMMFIRRRTKRFGI